MEDEPLGGMKHFVSILTVIGTGSELQAKINADIETREQNGCTLIDLRCFTYDSLTHAVALVYEKAA